MGCTSIEGIGKVEEIDEVEPSQTDPDLLVGTWLWRTTEFSDGNTFTPVSWDTFTPHIRFTAEHQQYGGNVGCNHLGGEFTAYTDGRIKLQIGASTLMLCSDDIMAAETLWMENDGNITEYIVTDDELHLLTDAGDRFIFEREGEVSVESRIYTAILNDWGSENEGTHLIVDKTAFNQEGVSASDTRGDVLDKFEVSDALLDAFFAAQNDAPITIEFPNGDVPLLNKAKYDALFSEGDTAGWEAFKTEYPNVEMIFTFSHIGFTDDEALVYFSVHMPHFHGGYYSHRSQPDSGYRANTSGQIWSDMEE